MDPGRTQRMLSNGEMEELRCYLSRVSDFAWLAELLSKADKRAEKVVNFGCANGAETRSLQWWLKADEAVGIDKCITAIETAQSSAQRIKTLIQPLSKETCARLVGNICAFPIELKSLPTYLKADITDPEQLSSLNSGHYDVSYCESVLYHIWDNPQDTEGMTLALSAVKEMSRVVKPGGWVIAVEPLILPDKRPLDFRPFFNSVTEIIPKSKIDDDERAILNKAGMIPMTDLNTIEVSQLFSSVAYLYESH